MIIRSLKHPDITVAIVGIVVASAVILFLVINDYHPIYLVTVGVGLICVVAYLPLSKWLDRETIYENGNDSWVFIAGALATFMIAILLFTLRSDPYVKPLGYYILCAIVTSFALAGIVLSRDKKQSYLLLGLACAIGLAHIWTESVMFPNSLIGIDPWAHMRTTTQTLAIAGTGTGVGYYRPVDLTTIGGGYSLMHIYLKAIIDVFGLSYKMASLIFVGSLQTVANIVLVYLIGKKEFGIKVGLMSALMLAIANWGIYAGEWIIPNSLGATFSLTAAFLIIKLRREKKYWLTVPILVVVALSYTTHLLAAIWVTGTICCMIVLPLAFDATERIKQRMMNMLKVLPIVLAMLALVFVWMNITDMGIAVEHSASAYDLALTTEAGQVAGKAPIILPDAEDMPLTEKPVVIPPSGEDTSESTVSASDEDIPIIVHENLNNGSLGELALSSMGMMIYIGVALIGGLLMIRQKVSPLGRTWVVLCGGVLAIGFVPSLLGITLLRERWLYFAEVLLAVPLAVALVGIPSTSRKKLSLLIVVCLVGIMAFLSTMGLPSNMTNRMLSPNLIVRYALTEKEMEGWEMAKTFEYQHVGADPVYLCFIGKNRELNVSGALESIDSYILTGDFRECPADMMLLRDALYKEPFGYGGGTIYKLGFNPTDVAIQQGYKEVWNNGEIHILVRK